MRHLPLPLKNGFYTREENRIYVDSDWRPEGVTAQFMDNAQTYHDLFFDNEYWKNLVARAIEFAQVDSNLPLKVLDIGSGSGNTVFAATELLPNSVVYACDISPQLLGMLVGIQEKIPHIQGRIEAYCFDLHKDFFEDNTFDLVIGGAVLHHMLDPQAVLKNVAHWLRPGGKILLVVEPLEIGAHIMSAIYLMLLGELEVEPNVDPRLLSFFKTMCYDYEARFGVPRIKPWTHALDDKWFFHESYLRGVANNIGLMLEFVEAATADVSREFSSSVKSTLARAGLGDIPTPDILWTILDKYDRGISPELKNKFTLEGIIIFTKLNVI